MQSVDKREPDRLLASSVAEAVEVPPPHAGAIRGSIDGSLALSIALLVLCWLGFCWPWLSGSVTIPWDGKAHFQPQIQFLAASLARGELPFWTPNVFAGHPQIADPQSTIFAPPFLLLALLDSAPSLQAVDTTVYLAVLFGGIGMFLLCRDFGWHWAAAVLAALAFQFGGVMAWRIQHFGQVLSLTYLPLTMFFLRRALERNSVGWGAAAGLFAALIAIGRNQVALLALYVLAAYIVWHWCAAPSVAPAVRKTIKPLSVAGAIALLVAVIPIGLTILLAGQSNRPEIDFIGAGRGSLHPALLVTSAAPDLFGSAGEMERFWGPPSFTWTGTDLFIAQNMGLLYLGAIPLLLLVSGALRGVFWSREIRFFSLAALAMLLYSLGWYTPAFRAAYELLPGVDLYRRPADAVFLVGALGAFLAGYAAHRLLSGTMPDASSKGKLIEIGVVSFIFLLGLSFALYFDRLDQAWEALLLAAASVALAAVVLLLVSRSAATRPLLAGVLMIGFTAVDLAVNNGPNGATALPPADIAMLEPDTRNETIRLLQRKVKETASDVRRDRVELAGLGFHWPNASLTHGLENTLGYNPIRLGIYNVAIGANDTVGLPEQRRFTPLFPSYRSRLADLLGLRFIATGVPIEQIDRRLHPGELKLIARTPDGYIYENPGALPRVLFAHQAVKGNFESMLKTGVWPPGDPATTVVLENPTNASPRRPGTARILRYENTEIVISVDSPDGGWVVLNDVWHPWWFAEIDGLHATLKRANVIFRAVEVPSGRHTVRFVFRPLAGALREVLNRM